MLQQEHAVPIRKVNLVILLSQNPTVFQLELLEQREQGGLGRVQLLDPAAGDLRAHGLQQRIHLAPIHLVLQQVAPYV